jgi:hypothetical protein
MKLKLHNPVIQLIKINRNESKVLYCLFNWRNRSVTVGCIPANYGAGASVGWHSLLYFLPAVLLYYMAYKVYYVKNNGDLM